MTVYDPSFCPGEAPVYNEDGSIRRLRLVPRWALVSSIQTEINGSGKNVLRVYRGGGGNVDGQCRPMSYSWLVEEVIGAMDPDSASPTRCKTWVEVKP